MIAIRRVSFVMARVSASVGSASLTMTMTSGAWSAGITETIHPLALVGHRVGESLPDCEAGELQGSRHREFLDAVDLGQTECRAYRGEGNGAISALDLLRLGRPAGSGLNRDEGHWLFLVKDNVLGERVPTFVTLKLLDVMLVVRAAGEDFDDHDWLRRRLFVAGAALEIDNNVRVKDGALADPGRIRTPKSPLLTS